MPAKWIITIDQLASSGGRQRYGPYTTYKDLGFAAEDMLRTAGLSFASEGSYQLTATPYTPEALERIRNHGTP